MHLLFVIFGLRCDSSNSSNREPLGMLQLASGFRNTPGDLRRLIDF